MSVTHVNRRRDTYYLHAGKTRTGKPRYWFSRSTEGDLVETIPEGYEIYENPDAQVFLRKIVPQLVTPAEIAVVEEGWIDLWMSGSEGKLAVLVREFCPHIGQESFYELM